MCQAFYVYLMANRSRTIYTGLTDNLVRRIEAHRRDLIPGFAARYGLRRLVYVEVLYDPLAAHQRADEIRNWPKERREALVSSHNPRWRDLADNEVSFVPVSIRWTAITPRGPTAQRRIALGLV